MTEAEALLAALIQIPSPNPPGDTTALADYIAQWLTDTGAAVCTIAPADKPEAVSVVATLGDGAAPVIMLHAHIDTVPVADDEARLWRSDPFAPVIRDEAMYGKGAIDDKGILAAMMMAFKQMSRQQGWQGTLVLVAAAEEEVGGQLGTRWLAESGALPPADFIVVGEQTHNRIALAHKGVMRATITVRGQSVHATNPDRGVNAITAMAKVIGALEAYHEQLRARKHPLVGHPTCNVGTIQGGSTENAVPDRCTLKLDRRMIPREDPEAVKRELREVVASVDLGAAEVEVGQFLFSSWFDSSLTTDLGQQFLQVVKAEHGPNAEPQGYLPGSDAKHLMDLCRGDMIIFGPGSYEVAHRIDEHIELSALAQSERILVAFLEQALFASSEEREVEKGVRR
jgi:acetylornithine deacetylase/succinyl-diaminopimelate desuccinylase family protein